MTAARARRRETVAADPSGRLIVALEGAELLAWSGEGMEPAWQTLGDGLYADVAVGEGEVWALGADGSVEQRRPADGALVHRVRPEVGAGRRLALGHGVLIVVGDDGVAWLRRGTPEGRVALRGVTAAAVGDGGTRALLLDEEGTATVVDLAARVATGRVTAGGPPVDGGWLSDGYWRLAVGRRLRPLRADGAAVAAAAPALEQAPLRIVPVLDGAALAVLVDRRRVQLVSPDGAVGYGTVTFGRDVTGLAALHHGGLIFGLQHGDVHRLDLLRGSGQPGRSHEGRARVAWAVDVRVDEARLRGLVANRAAGGQPLAVYVPPMQGSSDSRWAWVAAGIGTLIAVLIAALITWWIVRSYAG